MYVLEYVYKSRRNISKVDCAEKRLDQSMSPSPRRSDTSRSRGIELPITRYLCLDTLHPRDLRVDRFHNDPIQHKSICDYCANPRQLTDTAALYRSPIYFQTPPAKPAGVLRHRVCVYVCIYIMPWTCIFSTVTHCLTPSEPHNNALSCFTSSNQLYIYCCVRLQII